MENDALNFKGMRYLLSVWAPKKASISGDLSSIGVLESQTFSMRFIRAMELERRPHVRLMLSRCEWKPRDIDEEAMKQDLIRYDIILWLSQMIRDPAVPIRQRLSAARQLSILNGWTDPKNKKPDEKSILADMMKAINGTSTGLPNPKI